jgi:subtilisin family serine protease
MVTLSIAGAPSGAFPGHHAAAARHDFVPDEVLVRFRAGTSGTQMAGAARFLGASVLQTFRNVSNLQLLRLPAGSSVASAAKALAARSDVRYAQPNFIYHVDGTQDTIPNDPNYSLQWHLNNTGQLGGTPGDDVDAQKAWDTSTGSSDVIAAVIDTGVQYTHPDLAANMWLNTAECNGTPGVDDDGNGYVDDCHGIDTINHDSDPMDDFGHGTHVSGIIGAVGNNSVGVTGINWNVRILPCKSHDATGNGTSASIIECYGYVEAVKARGENVIATNNSYGGCPEACGFDQATMDGIGGLASVGVLFVASAGNDGANNDTTLKYPADYFLPNVISVAATTNTDALAFFSNYGVRTVAVGAPGDTVFSTWLPSTYTYLSGTSMASPQVTGIAALLHAANPALSWFAIRNLIIAGGETRSSMAGKSISGRRVNANGSLLCSNVPVFGILQPLESVTGGAPMAIAALNINCAVGAGALSVSITPGGQTISLRDKGKLGDLQAGDGVYSALWNPCTAGTFTLTFSNGGTPAAVTVTGATPCISLLPKQGPPGSQTTVTGSGYQANEQVRIFFDAKVIGSATADGTGSFSQVVTIPVTAHQGSHLVQALGKTSAELSQATFNVT